MTRRQLLRRQRQPHLPMARLGQQQHRPRDAANVLRRHIPLQAQLQTMRRQGCRRRRRQERQPAAARRRKRLRAVQARLAVMQRHAERARLANQQKMVRGQRDDAASVTRRLPDRQRSDGLPRQPEEKRLGAVGELPAPALRLVVVGDIGQAADGHPGAQDGLAPAPVIVLVAPFGQPGAEGTRREADGGRGRELQTPASAGKPCGADMDVGQQVMQILSAELSLLPFEPGGAVLLGVQDDQHRLVGDARRAQDAQRRAVADQSAARRRAERRQRRQDVVQPPQMGDEVGLGAPVERARAMHVDLLRGQPLDAVGDAERAGLRGERGQRRAHGRPGGTHRRQPRVVVRLGEVHRDSQPRAAAQQVGEIARQRLTPVHLEDFRVGPVHAAGGQQPRRRLGGAAKPLQEEERVGILAAHPRHDVAPDLAGDHVARVAAEAVDAMPRPVQEHLGQIPPQPPMAEVQLAQILPHHSPGARTGEAAVVVAAEPLRMLDLQRRGPARVVNRQIQQHQAAARMNPVHQLAELLQRRRPVVELGHGRVDAEVVDRREGTAVAAHPRVGRRGRLHRQQLENAEPQRPHDVRQLPQHVAEAPGGRQHRVLLTVQEALRSEAVLAAPRSGGVPPELAHEGVVDGVARGRSGRLHLDAHIRAGHPVAAAVRRRHKQALRLEHAHLAQRQRAAVPAAAHRTHRHVTPGRARRRRSAVHLPDHLVQQRRRASQARAHIARPLCLSADVQLKRQDIPAVRQHLTARSGLLLQTQFST